ncbi:hypothetical protein DWB84_10820 [Saccharophagus sp. K07]|jgi:cytochrome c556|uniref:hypothetical protein n=1 Tax=Saccharophagus sp. K07 TaxID=2283636 RepID=UPI001652669D|nr:hypothetical protein [Saccharophagus sp. K07]MBC6905949.1 hypothetical protein [Saccharophagus sp. K07]
MAAIVPILKALLPHVAQIATVAIPAFTKKEDVKADPLIAQQIEELQAAATRNAESIHSLADKLQQTIQGIELAAEKLERDMTRMRRLLMLSWSLSAVAIIAAVVALYI